MYKVAYILGVVLFCILFSFSTKSMADTVENFKIPLVNITNDRDNHINKLGLIIKNINGAYKVFGVYMKTLYFDKNDDLSLHKKEKIYLINNIENKHGVVLGQGQGVKAILMSGSVSKNAGSLIIHYLHNGLFKSYRTCKILLRKTSPKHWVAYNNYNGNIIKDIKVETWSLGISTIKNVCPE